MKKWSLGWMQITGLREPHPLVHVTTKQISLNCQLTAQRPGTHALVESTELPFVFHYSVMASQL
jgi:hypothetical protein